MKRNYGETFAEQRLALAHWYCKAVWKYKDDPKSQPFDQHLLLACIAPRTWGCFPGRQFPCLLCAVLPLHLQKSFQTILCAATSPCSATA